VRERTFEVITVHALKKSAIAQKDGTRRFFLKADNLLPLFFGIPELGLTNTSLDARSPPGILGLPRGGEKQPDCQCHRTPNFVHVKAPPSRSDGIPPERPEKKLLLTLHSME
jgi:hypothetical protein